MKTVKTFAVVIFLCALPLSSIRAQGEFGPPIDQQLQYFCGFMLDFMLLERALVEARKVAREQGKEVPEELSRRLEALERDRKQICTRHCWDKAEDCESNCLAHDYDCFRGNTFNPNRERFDEQVVADFDKCRAAYLLRILPGEHQPYLAFLRPYFSLVGVDGLLDYVSSGFEGIANFYPSLKCPDLFESLEYNAKLFEHYSAKGCKENALDIDSIQEALAQTQSLEPNFRALRNSGLTWVRHWNCYYLNVNEDACYQSIIDRRVASLQERLRVAHNKKKVCGTFQLFSPAPAATTASTPT